MKCALYRNVGVLCNRADVIMNEIHSEVVERNELSVPGVPNSLLGIKLKMPARGESLQLAQLLSMCHLSPNVWKHSDSTLTLSCL